MKALRRFVRRLISPATSARDEEFLRAEFDEHVAMQAAEFVRAGMPPDEARRQALLKFGSVEAIKESYRDERRLPWLDTLSRDTRFALRRLRKTPGFTVAVVLTLALGVGGNTAIFGVIESVLIKPLPYPEADALVSVRHTAKGLPGIEFLGLSGSQYFTYREQSRTFDRFGIWYAGGASVTGLAEPEMPRALYATPGVLDALRVEPLLGRAFLPADETPGAPGVVILTYGYWQRRFGGDTSVVGRTLTIDAKPHTVVGVLPETFQFQRDPELVLPLRLQRSGQFLGGFGYQGVARLRPGVTLERADAEVTRLLGVWLASWAPNPGMDRALFEGARFGAGLQPLKEEIIGDVGTALWIVMGTLGLVLLIVCANVANLLLVRAEARQHELAIRAALGAGWRRIAREMFVESLTLGVLGGAAGAGLAYVGLRILVVNGPDTLPRLRDIGMDPLVLAFAAGVSLLSGAIFGLIPILKYARPRIAAALRGVGRGFSDSRDRHRVRNALVVVQVALALVLSIGSGLMIRTFQQLRDVQPGFTHPEQIQILHSMAPPSLAGQPERIMRMQHEILDRLGGVEGVISVGFANAAPLETFLIGVNPIQAEDRISVEGKVAPARHIRRVAPGFFATLGTRVVAGRDFTWSDLYDRRRVAIVSENLAREWWGDPRAALGKRVREVSAADPWREIVGVVEDVHERGVSEPAPTFTYWPALMDQYIWDGKNGSAVGNGMFAIRSTRTATPGFLDEVQQVIWSVNGRQPVFLVTTMKALYDQSLARTSFTLVLLLIAGVMALAVGIVGLYGVTAYVVSQRTREIGIRAVLGAPPAGLLGTFMRHGLWLAGLGTVLGLVAAAGLTRLMSSLLFGVAAIDVVTYAAVSALLIAAALLASYLPARRAITIDPVEALRSE